MKKKNISREFENASDNFWAMAGSHVKKMRMFVVSLKPRSNNSGNCRFWSHLGCWEWKPNIFSHEGLTCDQAVLLSFSLGCKGEKLHFSLRLLAEFGASLKEKRKQNA